MDKAALLHAADLAMSGKWDEAHRIVQKYEDEFACLSGRQACWIHTTGWKAMSATVATGSEGREKNSIRIQLLKTNLS